MGDREAYQEIVDGDMYRLLIADDDDDVRGLLRAQLARLGHNVVAEARNGAEAVQLAAEHAPNMAILDVRMPVMDGIDAANRILQDNPCPVIFLTAYVEEDTVARAGETGAFYYLVKPFRTEDLAPAMTLSAARFKQYQDSQYLLRGAQKDLDDRKTIERAKGVLMEQFGLTEQEAFKKIHFAARNSNRQTAVVAAEVLESGQIPS